MPEEQIKKEKEINEIKYVSKDEVFGSKNRTFDLTAAQQQTAMTLSQAYKNDSVLKTVSATTMTADEMENAYKNNYVEALNVKKAKEGSREMKRVKKKAAQKARNAVELQKQLMELADINSEGKESLSYRKSINSNLTLKRLMASDNPEHDAFKRVAPQVFERGIKLNHVLEALESQKDKVPDLYAYAEQELERAQNEWKKIEELFYTPTYKEEAYQELIKQRREANSKVGNEIALPMEYMEDLDEKMKKRVLYGKNKNYEPQGKMKKVLDEEMEKVKKAYPGVTEEEVEETINEYLERILDRAEFHMRAKLPRALNILASRAHCAVGNDEYNTFVKKMFSDRPDNPDCSKLINFAYLGSKTPGGALFNRTLDGFGTDFLNAYGNIVIKLDKKKFLKEGFVSFLVGNSLENYDEKHSRSAIIDKEKGTGPDITCCGKNLFNVYKRAAELKKNGWKNMLSAEQEGQLVSGADVSYRYFEAHFHGNICAREIEEVTYVLQTGKASSLSDKKRIRKDKNLRALYDSVNAVNQHPDIFKRDKDKKLKLTVWDKSGNCITYPELINIMEAPDEMFKEEKEMNKEEKKG